MELYVFVGIIKYLEHGGEDCIVSTTLDVVVQYLIEKMKVHLELMYCEEFNSILSDMSTEEQWDYLMNYSASCVYDCVILEEKVHSDEHILKHLIRQSTDPQKTLNKTNNSIV